MSKKFLVLVQVELDGPEGLNLADEESAISVVENAMYMRLDQDIEKSSNLHIVLRDFVLKGIKEEPNE